jgi:hypothetical protein
MSYASGTSVPVERSKAELSTVLAAHGCDDVCIGDSAAQRKIMILFSYREIRCRLTIPTPALQEERFRLTATKRRRTPDEAAEAWRQEMRRVWRVIVLTVKARFEEIDNALFTPAQALVSWALLADGTTIHDRADAAVKRLSEHGSPPTWTAMLGVGQPQGNEEKP